MVFARERKKLSKNLDTVDSLKSRISGGTTEQHFWDIQTAVSRPATTLCKQSLYVSMSSRMTPISYPDLGIFHFIWTLFH